MAKFATFDAAGLPAAFYAGDVSGPRTLPIYGPVPAPTEDDPNPVAPVIGSKPNPDCKIPAEAVEITDEQWRDFLAHPGERKWDAATASVVIYEPPAPVITADEVTAEAQRRINAASHDALVNLNVFGTPIPEAVKTLCTAIQTAGTTIAAMDPIPVDYAADSRWPATA